MNDTCRKSIIIPLFKCTLKILDKFSLYSIWKLFWKNHELIPFWFAEAYIFFWLILISALFITIPSSCNLLIIPVILSIYRLCDILISNWVIIFIQREHRLDTHGHYILVRHVGRWIVMIFFNIFEIILYFSVLFMFFRGDFQEEIVDKVTAFYQSILTATTLGYGEIHPISRISKILVIFQLFYFIIFILMVLPVVLSAIRAKEVTNEGFGEINNQDKIKDWVINEDIKCRDLRKENLEWLINNTPDNEYWVFHGGTIAKYLFEEARYCFVYSQFLATIILGFAFIEHTLTAMLFASGRNDLEKANVSKILKEALKIGLLYDEEYQNLIKAKEIRNPIIHFRKPSDKEDIDFKAILENKQKYDIIKEDAEYVMKVMLKLINKNAI